MYQYILFTAIIVEGIVSYLKMAIADKKIHYEIVASAAIGIAIAVSYRIDLFELMKIETTIPYIGSVLTGILISRGSNYVYDLLKKIADLKKEPQVLNQYERPKDELNKDIVNHEV